MIKIKSLLSLVLAAGAALSLTAPAFALDYSFTSKAPQDYYVSTSYEDVYGSQYSYGGRNDNIPDLGYGRFSTTQTGVMERAVLPGLRQIMASKNVTDGYGIVGSGGPITQLVEDNGTGAGSGPAGMVIPDITTVPSVPAYTGIQGMTYQDGSLGTLKIPSIGVTVKIYEGTDTAALAKGAGHFEDTGIWNGNVCLAGHNRGNHAIFGGLRTLSPGDIITLTTVYGTRTYQVTMVKVISYTDWSYIQPTADNRITLTTCVEDQPTQRICVQAVEISA